MPESTQRLKSYRTLTIALSFAAAATLLIAVAVPVEFKAWA